jgi:hypothetical protein
MSFLKSLFLLGLAIIPISCKKIGELTDELKVLRQQTIFSVDEAITTLHNDSNQWEFVLKDLNSKLDSRVQQTLTYDIPRITAIAVGESTSGVLCVKDAVGDQVLYYLQIIKAELLTGETPPLPRTKICITSHSDIDLNSERTGRTTIIYYGYNIHRSDSIQAFLVKGNRTQEVMIPKIKIQFPTEYKFTVGLDGYSDAELSNFDYLDVRYGKTSISAISIKKKAIVPKRIQRMNVAIANNGLVPPHTRGDREFDGHGPRTNVNVNFYYDRNQVYFYIYMIAEETQSDWTTAVGYSGKIVAFTAPSGWHIKSVIGATSYNGIVKYTDTNNEPDIFQTPLGQATCVGDTKGEEAGIRTGVSFQFTYKIPIDIEED